MARTKPAGSQWDVKDDDSPVDVTPSLKTLLELDEARAAEAAAKKLGAKLTDRVKAYFTGTGHTLGTVTVGGKAITAVTCRTTETFNRRAFEADFPDLVTHYTREVVVQELDVAALRRERPDLFAKYQARALKINPKAIEAIVNSAVTQPPAGF